MVIPQSLKRIAIALSNRSLCRSLLVLVCSFHSLVPVPSPVSVFMSWTQLRPPARPRPRLCLTSQYFSLVIPVTDPRLPHGPRLCLTSRNFSLVISRYRPTPAPRTRLWIFLDIPVCRLTTLTVTLLSRFSIKPLFSS